MLSPMFRYCRKSKKTWRIPRISGVLQVFDAKRENTKLKVAENSFLEFESKRIALHVAVYTHDTCVSARRNFRVLILHK
jgi:hypothetical protein